MTKFEVGDIVYIKGEIVEDYKKFVEQARATAFVPKQSCSTQVGLAKDIPFTIIHIDLYDNCHLTNFNDSWGTYQGYSSKGKKYKTWSFSPSILEKRDLNTVSLFELNRGL